LGYWDELGTRRVSGERRNRTKTKGNEREHERIKEGGFSVAAGRDARRKIRNLLKKWSSDCDCGQEEKGEDKEKSVGKEMAGRTEMSVLKKKTRSVIWKSMVGSKTRTKCQNREGGRGERTIQSDALKEGQISP